MKKEREEDFEAKLKEKDERIRKLAERVLQLEACLGIEATGKEADKEGKMVIELTEVQREQQNEWAEVLGRK